MEGVGSEQRASVKSIWRLVTWLARESWIRFLWWSLYPALGSRMHGRPRKIQFISNAVHGVRRGIAFDDDPKDLLETDNGPRVFVVYLAYNKLASRTEESGTFLSLADHDVTWIDGWEKRDADALVAAQALL